MIKQRYGNPEVQYWYEEVVRLRMRSVPEYIGLTEEEADEKVFNDNDFLIEKESVLKDINFDN